MRYKINIYNLLTYMLIFAIIKPYFLPEAIRQITKITILIIIFFFVISKSEKKNIFNISLILCVSVLVSAFYAGLKGNYGTKDFLDSLLYILAFYNIYTFMGMCYYKGRFNETIKCMFNLILVYCILTVCSVMQVGIVNNSNQAAYVFGNKFTSSYLFILLLTLYGATHDMKKYKNKIKYYILFIFSILFTLHLDCATATVTLVILFAMDFIPMKAKNVLLKPTVVVIVLILSALIVTSIGQILKIDFVNQIVSGYFNKSYTVTGRLEIYTVYLGRVIMGSFWLGYGYSNSFMQTLTGVYANAQNGLLEIFVNFGFIGTLSVLVTVFYCYKKGERNSKTFYLSLVVYGMIIAAIFEISLNWFFLLGLCLIRWNISWDDKRICIH